MRRSPGARSKRPAMTTSNASPRTASATTSSRVRRSRHSSSPRKRSMLFPTTPNCSSSPLARRGCSAASTWPAPASTPTAGVVSRSAAGRRCPTPHAVLRDRGGVVPDLVRLGARRRPPRRMALAKRFGDGTTGSEVAHAVLADRAGEPDARAKLEAARSAVAPTTTMAHVPQLIHAELSIALARVQRRDGEVDASRQSAQRARDLLEHWPGNDADPDRPLVRRAVRRATSATSSRRWAGRWST